MPIQQNPNKRRGEERSETLIIPHITREMLEVARAMAEKGVTYRLSGAEHVGASSMKKVKY